ncbi:hypothetical protein [Arthrobacter sp. CJ23]|uniref:hypothetical protein n=1 Tax=Arthrobacter sp. CJ23 TaxID=2972479 RepID=UPI00215D2A1B|nr:hypothetical protein [Arthrobacter sp. CJ23]UVJ38035.1 hypothetical protein NVV90_12265 [Arthrobacter sp. CJ23]
MRVKNSHRLDTPLKAGPTGACLQWFRTLNRSARFAAVLLLAGLMILAGPAQAANAAPTGSLSPADQAKSFAYYKALRSCMGMGFYKNSLGTFGSEKMSQQNATDFEWFNGRQGPATVNGINVGAFNDPRGTSGDGNQNCGDSEGRAWIKAAAGLWGYDSGPKLLCQLGFTREQSGVSCDDTTAGANNDFIAPGGHDRYLDEGTNKLDDFWKGHLQSGTTDIGSITAKGGAYRLYLDNLKSQCRLSPGGSDYTIQEFATGATTPTPAKYGSADRDRGPGYMVTIYDGTQMSCRDIASQISDPNSAVVKGYTLFASTGGTDTNQSGGGDTECLKTGTCPENTSSCAIDGIGWIVCPVITFVSGLADSMFTVLSNDFLKVGTSVVNTDPKKGATTTYETWKTMQGFANIILVIAFLLVIFSQLTSVGLSNLGVKKMLPKIVIAAILMNVSFFICQIAVDLSNIIGYSLKDMLTGMASQASSGAGKAIDAASGNVLGGTNGWANLAGGILAAGTTVVAGYFMLSMLGGLLFAAVLALFMILLILIARQGIIVLAIVTAPIAIAFWLLPNTKSLATSWWKIFSRMLLLFPIISLIFGASTLASVILRDSFGSFTEANGNVNWLGQIVAAGIQVVPLFLTPLALKGALASVPMLGNLASKMSGRANANLGKKFGDSYRGSVFGRGRAIRKQAKANYRDRKFAKSVEGGGAAAIAAGGLASLGWTESQRAQKEAIVRAASGTAASAQSEAVKQQMKVLQDHVGTNPEDILKHIEAGHSSMSDTDMQAASDLLLASGGTAELRKIMQNPAIMQRHARSVVESSRRNESVVRQKAPDLANWASTAAAAQGSAYQGETVAPTYSGAQASKLVDLDPASAEAGKAHIDPKEARRALDSQAAINMKPGVRAVLEEIAEPPPSTSGPTSRPSPPSGGGSPSGPAPGSPW